MLVVAAGVAAGGVFVIVRRRQQAASDAATVSAFATAPLYGLPGGPPYPGGVSLGSYNDPSPAGSSSSSSTATAAAASSTPVVRGSGPHRLGVNYISDHRQQRTQKDPLVGQIPHVGGA